jgi:hypothetical protein
MLIVNVHKRSLTRQLPHVVNSASKSDIVFQAAPASREIGLLNDGQNTLRP